MIRTNTVLKLTYIVAVTTSLSACNILNPNHGPIRSFSGADLIRWGQEAPTTECGKLLRRKAAINGLYTNQYKSSMKGKLVLMQLGISVGDQINAQIDRCPQLRPRPREKSFFGRLFG